MIIESSVSSWIFFSKIYCEFVRCFIFLNSSLFSSMCTWPLPSYPKRAVFKIPGKKQLSISRMLLAVISMNGTVGIPRELANFFSFTLFCVTRIASPLGHTIFFSEIYSRADNGIFSVSTVKTSHCSLNFDKASLSVKLASTKSSQILNAGHDRLSANTVTDNPILCAASIIISPSCPPPMRPIFIFYVSCYAS